MPSNEISLELEEAFVEFLEAVPADRLSRELREIFFEYLIAQYDSLPNDFQHVLEDLFFLFALLDKISQHATSITSSETSDVSE